MGQVVQQAAEALYKDYSTKTGGELLIKLNRDVAKMKKQTQQCRIWKREFTEVEVGAVAPEPEYEAVADKAASASQ